MSAAFGVVAFGATPAQAHIDAFGPLKDRGGNQKTRPCGGVARSAAPYVFEPGATISLGVSEKVLHDGYFRISFDDDGEDGFKDPQSINPLNPNRYGPGKKCQGTPEDRCGVSDFCNVVSKTGPTVLWDNLDPHVTPTALGDKKWTWTVTLPNIECENCTIQVMQVMEDPVGDAHGPFDGVSDLYYRCIDVKLKKGVGKTPGTVEPGSAPANKGVDCLASPPAAGADAGSGSDAASGGDASPVVTPKGDGGTLAFVQGDESLLGSDDESASGEYADSGCSVAPRATDGSRGVLALLLGSALMLRNRRRRRS